MVNHALIAQLTYIRDRVETPVSDFTKQFQLGHFGRQIIDGLIETGWVQRAWKRSRGLYSLTDEGLAKLAELETEVVRAKLTSPAADKSAATPRTEKPHAQPAGSR